MTNAITTTIDSAQSKPSESPVQPKVSCLVRARIPTDLAGTCYLHLYENNVDKEEHMAIVFGANEFWSRSLKEREEKGLKELKERGLCPQYDNEKNIKKELSSVYGGVNELNQKSSSHDSKLRTQHLGLTPPRSTSSSPSSSSSLRGIQSRSNSKSPLSHLSHSNSPHSLHSHETNRSDSKLNSMNTSSGSNTLSSTSTNQNQNGKLLPPPLVRIHSSCFTSETIGSARCDCADQLREAMSQMANEMNGEGRGVIVYLKQEGRGIGLRDKLR